MSLHVIKLRIGFVLYSTARFAYFFSNIQSFMYNSRKLYKYKLKEIILRILWGDSFGWSLNRFNHASTKISYFLITFAFLLECAVKKQFNIILNRLMRLSKIRWFYNWFHMKLNRKILKCTDTRNFTFIIYINIIQFSHLQMTRNKLFIRIP